MYQSYEAKLNHPADFRVSYRFYEIEEGGRKTMPFQGLRSDFAYDHIDQDLNLVFMIWPEFENEQGELIDENIPVNKTGTARMWIIIPERRKYHKDKIKVGLKGYFMEGVKVAECEVIEIIGLNTNPTE